jgi:hypothetical protein
MLINQDDAGFSVFSNSIATTTINHVALLDNFCPPLLLSAQTAQHAVLLLTTGGAKHIE